MRIAIIQRILPDFRYDLFKLLNEIKNSKITIFFGDGQKSGATKNTKRDYSAFANKILTIPYLFKKYRVIHPTLIYHLIKFNADVIITEPSTYFPNNFVAFLYSKLFKIKFIWWEAGLVDHRSTLRNIIEPFIKIMIRNSDSYITYSSFAKQYLISEYSTIPDKIFIAQNTISNNYIKDELIEKNIKKEYGITENDLILSYIGSMDRRKNIEIIFDTLEFINERMTHLFIIGDGKDLKYYKEYSSGITRNKIHFIGRKEKNDANHYLAISKYSILPAEGGLAINHSLSVGTPVICGRNDGTEKDLIKNGFNGFILDEFTSIRIKEILLFFNFNKEKIMDHFIMNFSISNMVQNINKAIMQN